MLMNILVIFGWVPEGKHVSGDKLVLLLQERTKEDLLRVSFLVAIPDAKRIAALQWKAAAAERWRNEEFTTRAYMDWRSIVRLEGSFGTYQVHCMKCLSAPAVSGLKSSREPVFQPFSREDLPAIRKLDDPEDYARALKVRGTPVMMSKELEVLKEILKVL